MWRVVSVLLGAATLLVAAGPRVAAQATIDEPRSVAEITQVFIKSPCFDRASLAAAVAEWLGRDRVDPRVTNIRVRASQGLLSFSIGLQGHPPMVRDFSTLPRDCSEQRGVIALSIAMAVDALEADLVALPTPSRPRWQASLQGVVVTQFPQELGWGATVGLARELAPWLILRASVVSVGAGNQPVEAGLAPRFDVRLTAARADACVQAPVLEALDIAGCAGVWAGGMTIASHGGLVEARTLTRSWLAASAALELRVRLGPRLALQLGADVLVPLRQARLQVLDMQDEIAADRKMPKITGALRIGPVVSF